MTEADIQKILHRAAELQALQGAEAATPLPEIRTDAERLRFLAEAAEEVGISRGQFSLATAELTGSPGQKAVAPEKAERARRWLGNAERVFAFEATLASPPEAVLASLQSVLASSDYLVDVANMIGEQPLVDGILVLEPADLSQLNLPNLTKFRYAMLTADFRQLLVQIRADTARPGFSRLSLHTSLDHSAVTNRTWARASMAFLSPIVGLSLIAVTIPLGPFASLAIGLLTGLATAAGIKLGWQKMYAWGLEQGKKAVKELAARVETTLRLKGI